MPKRKRWQPTVGDLMGQFESEEAHEQFKAEWEVAKPSRTSVPVVPR